MDILLEVRQCLDRGETPSSEVIAKLCDALEEARSQANERWDAISRLAPAAKRLRAERDSLRRKAIPVRDEEE